MNMNNENSLEKLKAKTKFSQEQESKFRCKLTGISFFVPNNCEDDCRASIIPRWSGVLLPRT